MLGGQSDEAPPCMRAEVASGLVCVDRPTKSTCTFTLSLQYVLHVARASLCQHCRLERALTDTYVVRAVRAGLRA